jgi:hypothetical protein
MFENVPENKVTIDLGGTHKINGDLTRMSGIDLGNLDKEVAQHPGEFTWVAVLYAKAKEVFQETEERRKQTEAEAYQHYLDTLGKGGAPGGKAPTVDFIKSMITLDEKVIAAKAQERVAERNHEILKGYLDAYRTRKDLIVAAVFGGLSEKKNATIPQTAQELLDAVQKPRRRATGPQ